MFFFGEKKTNRGAKFILAQRRLKPESGPVHSYNMNLPDFTERVVIVSVSVRLSKFHITVSAFSYDARNISIVH